MQTQHRNKVWLNANDFFRGASTEALDEEGSEALGELGIGISEPIDLAVVSELGNYPHLGDAALDFVLGSVLFGGERVKFRGEE